MSLYILSPDANRDLLKIWVRISRDSIAAADNVEATIIENCEILANTPGAGHKRGDLTRKPVLIWPATPYKNYYIVYRRLPDHVYILRVVHSARRRVWKRGI